MNRFKIPLLTLLSLTAIALTAFKDAGGKNRDPYKTELITVDLDNFWMAFDAAKPDFDPAIFQKTYIKQGSKGLKGFMSGRIKNAANLSKVVSSHKNYYASIRESTAKISGMKDEIRRSLAKLKDLYPEAVFPPVYFVVGTLNSGGTASRNGLIIGADMYGLTSDTPKDELNNWLKTVIKPVDQVPHIVAHELIHFQQNYDGRNLLSAAIKEGSADFIAELISGKHINEHVHEFANPKEEELWQEFKSKMLERDYSGWLYSSQKGRPNDLGYWMGYKITKSYYDNKEDKKMAMNDIMNIKNFEKFLQESKYEERFL